MSARRAGSEQRRRGFISDPQGWPRAALAPWPVRSPPSGRRGSAVAQRRRFWSLETGDRARRGRGGPYLLPAGPRRGAARCGPAWGRRGAGCAPRAARGCGACAPRGARRARVSRPCVRRRPLPGVPAPRRVRVRTQGPRPPGAAAVSRHPRPKRGVPRRPAPAPGPAPAQPLCPAGEAPPPPRSQARGGRRAADHHLPPRASQARGWGAGQWASGGGVRPGWGGVGAVVVGSRTPPAGFAPPGGRLQQEPRQGPEG